MNHFVPKDGYSVEDLGALVEPDRVHKSVYADPAVFDLEMERVFGRAWIYVGHESEAKNKGDFKLSLVGKQQVIMVRAPDGKVHELFNRCAHKGARMQTEPYGNTGNSLRCPYHGWSFRCDGSLLAVPEPQAYAGTAFDKSDPNFSMRRLPRQQSYRGFMFASLAEDGPDLDTFLGGVKLSLDNFCDRSPMGEVEVAGGVQRVMQRSNWKMFFENLHDTNHPMVTHQSSFLAAREQHAANTPGTPMPFKLHVIEGNGEPYEFWDRLGLVGYEYGHGYMTAIFNAPQDEVWKKYAASLEAAHGAEKTRQILETNLHNTIVYPSCSPHTGFQQLRVIRPVSVDRTMVEIYTFRLKGAPEEMFHRAITYANIVNSPASVVMPDDVEVYARCQEGLAEEGGDWISQHRYVGEEKKTEKGWIARGLSEFPMRNQFRVWRRYMTGEI